MLGQNDKNDHDRLSRRLCETSKTLSETTNSISIGSGIEAVNLSSLTDGTEQSTADKMFEGSDNTQVVKDPNKPVFTKKDFLSVLEEKNCWKEKADQLEEELEEWKRLGKS